MALLLETIKINDGIIENIAYHQKRVNQSRQELFGMRDEILLLKLIKAPSQGLFKCRILYDTTIKSIEYIPYIPKNITSLKIVSSALEYRYKYANREIFELLLKIHNEVDDIIITKDGYLTDISYANIAFYDNTRWVTPKTPLLRGTMREKLVDEGFLHPMAITKEMLLGYEKMAILNAMVGFKILKEINPKEI